MEHAIFFLCHFAILTSNPFNNIKNDYEIDTWQEEFDHDTPSYIDTMFHCNRIIILFLGISIISLRFVFSPAASLSFSLFSLLLFILGHRRQSLCQYSQRFYQSTCALSINGLSHKLARIYFHQKKPTLKNVEKMIYSSHLN